MSDWANALHQAAMELQSQKTESERPKTRNQLPPRICMDCGKTFQPSVNAHWRCDECFKKTRSDRHREIVRDGNVYDARWERFKQHLRGCGNVQCQRIENGIRCTRPVWAYHHILEARDFPSLAYDWRNVVGVCVSHHPRPGQDDQGRYVPTRHRTPMSFEPITQPEGIWDRDERLKALKGDGSEQGPTV